MIHPIFGSERLMPGPPYKGCGVSSTFHLAMLATNNEASINRYGRQVGQGGIRSILRRGWFAFVNQPIPDSNGIPDQGDVLRIHSAMFPRLPAPQLFNTRAWSEVVNKLKDGYAVSIALKLSAVPASSPLRKYTSADHQVTLYGHNNGKTRRIDPMHGASNNYIGEWVPLADVRKAAFGFGQALTFIAPIGEWTEAKLATKALQSRVNVQRHTIDRVRSARDAALDLVAERDLEIASLTMELAQCKEEADCEAVRIATLDQAVAAIEDLRLS